MRPGAAYAPAAGAVPEGRSRPPVPRWAALPFLLALTVLSGGWSAAAAGVEPAPAAEMQVAVAQDGRLSVDLNAAPLPEVLRAIGDEAGMRVAVAGGLDRAVTWAFADLPLAKGLRRLLAGTSWALVRGEGGVRELHVLGAGAREVVVAGRPVRALGEPSGRRGPASAPAILRAGRGERLHEARRLAADAGAGDVEMLAAFLAGDEAPAVRRTAAIGLGKVGGDRAREALAAALSDGDATVRHRAVLALGRGGDALAVEPLADALVGDPDAGVRRQAARGLARLGGEEAFLALQTARADADPAVRREATEALQRWQ